MRIELLINKGILNGNSILSMKKKSTPKAHMSTSKPYIVTSPPEKISGDINCSVPRIVPPTSAFFLLNPKSASL